MTDPTCCYAMLHASRERIEEILLDHVHPLVDEMRDAPELDSLFFVRFSEPSWQLRVRILGRPQWIEDRIAPRLRSLATTLERARWIERCEFATYDREFERYGGTEGMRLAEQLFFLDSLAALDWMAAERRGAVTKSRREFSILLIDRLLDLAAFTRAERLAFYRHGYAWATETEAWGAAEVAALEARFQALRPGLEAVFFGPSSVDPATLWGGEAAARVADTFLTRARPIVESLAAGIAAGRIAQDRVYLFWSYAHMFSNRLGIEAAGEAVLRFFVHRLLQEHREVGV